MDLALAIALVAALVGLVGLLVGPIRTWVRDRRDRPSLELRLGQAGFIADVSGERRHRLRLEVSNEEGRAPADDVEVVVVEAEIPPRVAASRPIRPDTSVERVGLPLRWADSSPPTSSATLAAGAARSVELLFFEDPPEDSQPPTAGLDLVPETARVEIELDSPMPLDDLVTSVPGLAGLEQVPAKVRLALRSRAVPEQRYTVAINYDGFWPFSGMFLPERMESHFKAKVLDGHAPYSDGPFRDPPEEPEDPDDGDWTEVLLPPRSWSDGILERRKPGWREREGRDASP